MQKNEIPNWVRQQQFVDILERQFVDFNDIEKFKVESALRGGENYLTNVLRVSIDWKSPDNEKQQTKYILKIPLKCDDTDNNEHEFHDLFIAESEMYKQIVPELEDMYKKYAGLTIKFKPMNYLFTEPPKSDYVLMEDLQQKGYKNFDRLLGLNETEVETVLKKLAQWHAASAKRVECLGDYSVSYRNSYFVEEHRDILDGMNKSFNGPFLECLEVYKITEKHKSIIKNYMLQLTELYLKFGQVHENNFNVLNHGDFWCNNFMYRYDAVGTNIDDICFVDFQLPKYGTPAQDLFCFLMSTPQFSIKLNKFDHFIEYYHRQLLHELNLLNYQKKLPTLSELHNSLQQNGLWAFVCAQRMLAVAQFPSSDDSTMENFMNDTEIGIAFKKRMLLNPSFVAQMEQILPWLIERNYLEYNSV